MRGAVDGLAHIGPSRRAVLARRRLTTQTERAGVAVWPERRRRRWPVGRAIEAQDLWIAATAVAHDPRVVTRNLGEFERVPGPSDARPVRGQLPAAKRRTRFELATPSLGSAQPYLRYGLQSTYISPPD